MCLRVIVLNYIIKHRDKEGKKLVEERSRAGSSLCSIGMLILTLGRLKC
jgi:hypothetical protein